MRIDIKNIFGSGSSGKSVDVKQVLESEAEQVVADAGSASGLHSEATKTAEMGGDSEREPLAAKLGIEFERVADASSGESEQPASSASPKPDQRSDSDTLAETPLAAEASTDDAQPDSDTPPEINAGQADSDAPQETDGSLESEQPPETGVRSEMKTEGEAEPNGSTESGTVLKSAADASQETDGSLESDQPHETDVRSEAKTEDASEPNGSTESGTVLKSAADAPQETDGSLESEQPPETGVRSEMKTEGEAEPNGSTESGTVLKSAADAPQETDGSSESEQLPETAASPAAGLSAIQKPPFQIKEKFLALCRRYGWCSGIAAAFAILLAVTLIYTTMIPREVYATINDKEFSFTTKEYTVEEFLQDEKIAFCEDDYISLPLTTYIYDGIKLEIDHATDFKVTADGKTKKYKTLDNTVQEALDDAGVKLRERDIVTPSLDTFMTQDIHIVVQRVEVEQEVVEEAIPFKTVTKNDSSLREGTTEVATPGQEGKDQVTYEVTYIDGVEASRTEIARQSVTAAVDEVIAKGTRIDYNGKTYSRKLVVKAYSYTGGGRTAMGTRARVGEIAVDPSVIPLGTNVYIEGVGARRAEDTGGNIKGNTIDIYMDSEAECRRWGVRYVTIYIQ